MAETQAMGGRNRLVDTIRGGAGHFAAFTISDSPPATVSLLQKLLFAADRRPCKTL
jgi:hypothetical protein